MDKAILRFIPEGDPDLTTYLNELFRKHKPVQHNNAFWLPTPKNAGKTDDHTPIQKRILRAAKNERKLNLKDDIDLRMKFLERFDWTDALLMETEKQTAVDFLVEYHDIFARLRMDIGMKAEFLMRNTPESDKSGRNQSLPIPIHEKGDLIVDLPLMQNYGIITVLPSSEYAIPIFVQRNPAGSYVFFGSQEYKHSNCR